MEDFNVVLMVSGVYSINVQAKSREEAIAKARADFKEDVEHIEHQEYGTNGPAGFGLEESYGRPQIDGEDVEE